MVLSSDKTSVCGISVSVSASLCLFLEPSCHIVRQPKSHRQASCSCLIPQLRSEMSAPIGHLACEWMLPLDKFQFLAGAWWSTDEPALPHLAQVADLRGKKNTVYPLSFRVIFYVTRVLAFIVTHFKTMYWSLIYRWWITELILQGLIRKHGIEERAKYRGLDGDLT